MARALALLTALTFALLLGAQGQAQPGPRYPERLVRIIVPYAAGGPTDLVARILSERFQERWGRPVIIDNRPGAGGNIGTDQVAKSEPDGYTLLLTASGPIAISPTLHKSLPFDPWRDLAPVSQLVSIPNILIVNPALPVRSVADLIALAKARPGTLNYASGGIGTPPHLAFELFKRLAGVDLTHVPYRGGPQAVMAVMRGEVAADIDSPTVLAQAQAGEVRAIAVTSLHRFSAAPEIPTVAESGLPGFEAMSWFGLLAPAATPAPVIEFLQCEAATVLGSSAVKARLVQIGFEPVGSTPQAFRDFIAAETAKWGEVVRLSGAQAE